MENTKLPLEKIESFVRQVSELTSEDGQSTMEIKLGNNNRANIYGVYQTIMIEIVSNNTTVAEQSFSINDTNLLKIIDRYISKYNY